MKKKTITQSTDKKIYNSLERWLNAASDKDWQDGKQWYKEAQDFCKYLASEFDIDSYTCAAVVSALSPNNKWQRNKIDAFNVIKAFKQGKTPKSVSCCTYNANKEKSFAILKGSIELSAKSPKTHSFAMNCGLLSSDHITIDKWHIRACLVRPCNGVTDTIESITVAQYRRIEAITVKLAHKYGLKGYELQAIIWVAIKHNWNR